MLLLFVRYDAFGVSESSIARNRYGYSFIVKYGTKISIITSTYIDSNGFRRSVLA